MNTQMLPVYDPKALNQAVELIARGELVAFPTDTVYGLGATAFDPRAIEKLFQAKGREVTKAIPILIGDIAGLDRVVSEKKAVAIQLAERFWPGPLTIVLPRHPSLPTNLSPLPTVGVRMPDHMSALGLLKRTGPLAVTSANLSKEPSATTALEVFDQLNKRIPLILDGGRSPGGLPSTVVDCTGIEPVILRPGPVSLDQLLDALR